MDEKVVKIGWKFNFALFNYSNKNKALKANMPTYIVKARSLTVLMRYILCSVEFCLAFVDISPTIA